MKLGVQVLLQLMWDKSEHYGNLGSDLGWLSCYMAVTHRAELSPHPTPGSFLAGSSCFSRPSAAHQLCLENLWAEAKSRPKSRVAQPEEPGKTPRTQAGPEPWPEELWNLDGTAL